MNIPKAIEILDLNVREAGTKMPADTLQALKLGVRALQAVEEWATDYNHDLLLQLLNDTKGD